MHGVDDDALASIKRGCSQIVETLSKAHFTGLWLEGPINTLMERVAKRKTDASEATADVVSAQAKQPTGAVDWLRVDASSLVEAIAARVLPAILG
jgi:predicted kinase